MKIIRRPDRPSVVLFDFLVSAGSLFLLFSATGLLQWYFLAGAWLFFWSGLHHWNTISLPLRVIDRAGIVVFIAMTPVPYLWQIFEHGFGWSWLLTVGAACIAACIIVFSPAKDKGWVYSLCHYAPGFFGSLSLVGVRFPELLGYIVLWTGVALFLLQGRINEQEWPNQRWCAYVQHLVLYMAYGLHVWCVLQYT